MKSFFRTWWGADPEPTIEPTDVVAAGDDAADVVDLVDEEARHIGMLAGEIKRWPCEILAAATALGIQPGALPNGLATLSEDEEAAVVAHLADLPDAGEYQASDYPRLVAAFIGGEHIDPDEVEAVLEAADMTADDFIRDTSESIRAHFQMAVSDLAKQYGE